MGGMGGGAEAAEEAEQGLYNVGVLCAGQPSPQEPQTQTNQGAG